jgi:hypothetical protein
MLVVTANWGLADGTLVPSSGRQQADFLAAVQRAACRAGSRADGRYEPIDRLDLVLAGDTFDALTSTAWTDSLRPWQASARAADTAARVLVAAAIRGRRLLAGLAAWARRGLDVPAADRRGRPIRDRSRRVPARVVILPGDRDSWLAAAAGRLARRGVRAAGAWAAGGVAVCHGAEFDPLWNGGPAVEGGQPTLGASLVVDLLARFGAEMRGRPGLWPVCRSLVGLLAAAQPASWPLVVGDWLAANGRDAAPVRPLWRAAVAGWRRQARRVPPACDAGCDVIDAVAAWMEGTEREPLRSDAGGELVGLLDPGPPRVAAAGTVVLGHWAVPAEPPGMVGLGPAAWRPAADEAVAGVTLAGDAAARWRRGAAHVVFPDPDRPAVRWRLLAEDHPPAWPRAAAVHRVVEAA